MTMTADCSDRLARVLREHADYLRERWVEFAAAALGEQPSQVVELRGQIEKVYGGLRSGLGIGEFDLYGDAAKTTRAALAEFSRCRAQRGDTVTEAAAGVLAFKDALLDVLDVRGADPTLLREYVAYSRLIDQMGLFTVEAQLKAVGDWAGPRGAEARRRNESARWEKRIVRPAVTR